ncbi:MAG: DUF222 domain-containing protein [Acidimicrobiales bacterium]|jgi:Domain of unknown function (DUF222)
MFVDKIREGVSLIQQGLAEFEPGLLTAQGAADLVGIAARGERSLVALKVLSARRVEQTNHHRHEGHRDAAKWLAGETGDTNYEAASLLAAARQMEQLPDVSDAFKAGKLSPTQARQVASAASCDPSKQQDLLEAAEKQTVSELRETCDRVKRQASSGEDEAKRHASIWRRRYVRDFNESDGAVRFDGRVCPEDGARLRAELMKRARRIAAEAKTQGRREPLHCYLADALMELVDGDRRESGSGPEVHVTVDSEALLRGYSESEESCTIEGVGQVSVQTARKLLGDGFLSILVTKGRDITTVASAGRAVPADVDRALRQRDRKCCVPGCEIRERLERDHRVLPFIDGGPTSLENLALLCRWHHYLRTYRGWHLEGEPGDWMWVGPSNDHRDDSPWGDRVEPEPAGQGSFVSPGTGPPD